MASVMKGRRKKVEIEKGKKGGGGGKGCKRKINF